MNGSASGLLSVALVVLGVAIVVRTLAAGGGPLALGVVLGVLFCAGGAARLWLTRHLGDDRGER